MAHPIFVGSSTEGLDKARQICDLLSRDGDATGVLWTEIFEPGFLTFEALEEMLRRCCAAVFVVTPDDQMTIRGKTVRTPRANVMLEFGLVAGRFGRHSVAVCQYGGAELPSDLQGLTVIVMDPKDGGGDADAAAESARDQIRRHAEQQLSLWTSRLLATTDSIPRTDVVHGYAGRWDFNLSLHTWRDLKIISPGYVQIVGYFDVVIPSSGLIGRGLAHGRLHFKVPGGSGADGFYEGEFRTAHDIRSAVCQKDGSLQLTTEAFALQKMNSVGKPPAELADIELLPEPWSAQWKLSPTSELRALEGTVRTQGAIVSEGTVKATKTSEESA